MHERRGTEEMISYNEVKFSVIVPSSYSSSPLLNFKHLYIFQLKQQQRQLLFKATPSSTPLYHDSLIVSSLTDI
jgi:hypothetical protein